jgi:hypothetical protein
MMNNVHNRPAGRAGLFASVLFSLIASTMVVALADKPDWQKHLDWSIGNHTTDPGETNCVEQYVATEPACITAGGRSCLMQRAIDSAKASNYDYALRLSLITQCHNGNAQSQIAAAGKQAVGDYLRSK